MVCKEFLISMGPLYHVRPSPNALASYKPEPGRSHKMQNLGDKWQEATSNKCIAASSRVPFEASLIVFNKRINQKSVD